MEFDNELIIRFEDQKYFFGDDFNGCCNIIMVNGEKIEVNGNALESILYHLGCSDIGNLDMDDDDLDEALTSLGYTVDISYG